MPVFAPSNSFSSVSGKSSTLPLTTVSQYNESERRGPANYMMLLVARASMTGMLVFDYADRYPEAMAELAGWYRAGRLVSRETVVSGSVEDFPETLLKLFEGANTGKMILAL